MAFVDPVRPAALAELVAVAVVAEAAAVEAETALAAAMAAVCENKASAHLSWQRTV